MTAPEQGLPDLPGGWSVRTPGEDDVAALAALRLADHTPYTGQGAADEESVRSEVVGVASWTRHQLVVSPPGETRPRGWVTVQDRAAGRTAVSLHLERDRPDLDAVAYVTESWFAERGDGRSVGSRRRRARVSA